MRRSGMRAVIIGISFLTGGCCNLYKQTVSEYTKSLPQRAAIYEKFGIEPELKKEFIMHDAALACLVDKDTGKSSNDKVSPSCACSEKSGAWETNCRTWIGGK